MASKPGLGVNVRLIRVAGDGAWVFLPPRYTSHLGIRVSIRRSSGTTCPFSTGSPLRRNHRKLGSGTLPLTVLTTALFTLPDVQLQWARGQARICSMGSSSHQLAAANSSAPKCNQLQCWGKTGCQERLTRPKKLCAREIGVVGPLIEKKQMLRSGLITCRRAAGLIVSQWSGSTKKDSGRQRPLWFQRLNLLGWPSCNALLLVQVLLLLLLLLLPPP